MSMVSEFKEFINQGNAMDMAVGIIIGAAFGKIVSALVDNVLMPIISVFSGGVDFSDLFINLGEGEYATLAAAKEAGVATLGYGSFIQALIDFLIIAFVIFMIIRSINKMKKPPVEEEEKPAGPSEVELLIEIRDSLKK